MAETIIRHVERGMPFSLDAIVAARPHQVASLSLWRSGASDVTVFAFAAGEGISREVLEEDRLYVVLGGDMLLEAGGRTQRLRGGDCLCVPARTEHSLDAVTAGKALLITVG